MFAGHSKPIYIRTVLGVAIFNVHDIMYTTTDMRYERLGYILLDIICKVSVLAQPAAVFGRHMNRFPLGVMNKNCLLHWIMP